MHRIQKLRMAALENTICYDEFFYNFYKCYGNSKIISKEKRYADAFYYALSNLTPSISDGELIVGKCNHKLPSADMEEWQNIYLPIAQEESSKAGNGQDSHMAINYELVLKHGINGIIKKIDTYSANCCDENKIDFYKACRRCLEAVIKFSENYADAAKKLSMTATDEDKRKELEVIFADLQKSSCKSCRKLL